MHSLCRKTLQADLIPQTCRTRQRLRPQPGLKRKARLRRWLHISPSGVALSRRCVPIYTSFVSDCQKKKNVAHHPKKCTPPDVVIDRLQSGRGGCLTLQFSHTGVFLAAAICDVDSFPIRIFQIAGLGNSGMAPATPLCDLAGHTNIVYDLSWSFDDSMLASASSDATVCVWDLRLAATAPVKVCLCNLAAVFNAAASSCPWLLLAFL
jgi:WD40 repeat protein